jgi:hypothetical protein
MKSEAGFRAEDLYSTTTTAYKLVPHYENSTAYFWRAEMLTTSRHLSRRKKKKLLALNLVAVSLPISSSKAKLSKA